ncbi:hypothetical protein [uncultured Sphaerotilus sp.]|uniref:WD40/YVTN/BNR-like repeat-containing protein n=1 Tax=uncultured Sphaerotilus sp. TaxID=474984 RepID=UPI0030CA4799
MSNHQSKSPLVGLVIRSAVVRIPGTGYIIACDVNKEKDDVPHAIVFRYAAGQFNAGSRNYNAHSLCVIDKPDIGYVDISEQGYYSVTLRSGMKSGDILKQSPQSGTRKKRTASFRSVAAIDGRAYAVGLRGLVYRFDDVGRWTCIDEGLPETFNIQAIDGFDSSDIYAVGRHGGLWHFDGSGWSECDLPTDINLTCVKCAGDGQVYIGGHKGVLIRGRDSAWAVFGQHETEDDIWDIEWFSGCVYVSSMNIVYWIKDGSLMPVDFGSDPPKSCYQLSSSKDVMWSNGEFDIMSFDGKKWVRVV